MVRCPGVRQPRVRLALTAAAAALLAAGAAQAQRTPAGAEGRTLWLQSSLALQETLTSNGNLSGAGGNGDDRRWDSVTQITPSFRIASRGGSVRADIDYSPSLLIYARERQNSEIQNTLNAVVDASLLDDRAFIAARAGVSQRTVSAFGTQSGRTNLVNDNRTEVATLSLSPSLRGSLAGIADYGVSASWSTTRASSTGLGDADSGSINVFLGGGGGGRFGWSVQAQRLIDDYAAGRRTTQDSATARLTWTPIDDVRLGVNGGREWTDVQTPTREGNSRWGLSGDWTPSERTQLSLAGDKRYFGHSHAITFTHRRPRSTWSYSNTRDVSSGSGQGLNTIRLSDLLIGIEPDPAKRDALIRNAGFDPNDRATYGFLLASLSEQRQQNLSVAYLGLRATVTLSAFRTETQRLDRLTTVFDDLSTANRVRQQGVTLGVSHRLTPTASVGAAASLLRTMDAGPVQGDQQRVVSLTWSDQIGARTNVSLSLRHSQADGNSANNYNETAAYGALYIRF